MTPTTTPPANSASARVFPSRLYVCESDVICLHRHTEGGDLVAWRVVFRNGHSETINAGVELCFGLPPFRGAPPLVKETGSAPNRAERPDEAAPGIATGGRTQKVAAVRRRSSSLRGSVAPGESGPAITPPAPAPLDKTGSRHASTPETFQAGNSRSSQVRGKRAAGAKAKLSLGGRALREGRA